MKKTIVTTLAITGLALGAYAQGSLNQVQTVFSSDGITVGGTEAANPGTTLDSEWYTGNIALEVFYASTASVTADQVAAINALDGVSGAAALALMQADGFSLVSATALTGSTPGSLNYSVSFGGLNPASNPNSIGLLAPTVTGTTAWLAFYAVATGGTYNGYSGALVWSQNTGGNPNTTPAGTPAIITTDPAGLNVVLTTVPEPCTMALLGLGGLSLLMIRRRK
jgi:hypothetical protein